MFTGLSVRTRLLGIILLFSLLPLLAVAVFMRGQSIATLQDIASTGVGNQLGFKRAQLAQYITALKNDVASMAESYMVTQALERFGAGYDDWLADIGRTGDRLSNEAPEAADAHRARQVDGARAAIQGYLAGPFATKYAEIHPGKHPNMSGFTAQLSDTAITLQAALITSNPHPLGEKHKLDAPDTPGTYAETHRQLHPAFRAHLERSGYYDFFIFNARGDLVYTVFKELDFATNLTHGPFADSGLGRVFRRALQVTEPGGVVIEDYSLYAPSYDQPAMFVGAPIRANGQVVGVFALQVNIEHLMAIVGNREGMQPGQDVYVVGPDGLLRSNSLEAPEQSVLRAFLEPGKSKQQRREVREALEGRNGRSRTLGLHGVEAQVAYGPVELAPGLRWALLAEYRTEFAFAEGRRLSWWLGLVVVAVALLAVICGLLFARRFTGPIIALSSAMQRVSKEGDFELRVAAEGSDELASAGLAWNGLGERLQTALAEISVVVGALADGQLEQRVTGEYPGALGQLKDRVNASADAISAALRTLQDAGTALARGELGYRINRRFSGAYQVVVQGVETGSAAISEAFDEINFVLAAMADGDFSRRIEARLPGELGTAKTRINASLDTLQGALDQIARVSALIADGKLGVTMDGSYRGQLAEVQCSMNASLRTLSSVIDEAREATKSVLWGGREIAQGNLDLSNRTEHQSGALEKTAASMEKMSSSIREIADNALLADERGRDAKQRASEGGAAVARVVDAMSAIRTSSGRIAEIIKLIDDIAFQTNLLALNAAVEAARAGDQGRGFAVVAQEVRMLAKRSADSAREIRQLIGEAASQVDEGDRLVGASGAALSEIVVRVGQASELLAGISTAIRDQSCVAQHINDELANLEALNQQNSALVEQTAATSQGLEQRAIELSEVLARFDTSRQIQATRKTKGSVVLPPPAVPTATS